MRALCVEWFLHLCGAPTLGDSPLGVYGYWTGLTVALSVVAIGAGLRLRYISSDYDRIRNLTAAEANAAAQI